jgi:hypothetical protein
MAFAEWGQRRGLSGPCPILYLSHTGIIYLYLKGCRKHDRQRSVVMQVNEYKLHWVASLCNQSIVHSYALCIIPLPNAGLLSKCLKTARFQSRPVSLES